ncbi:MAG: immunoglobulin domain-containing protein, partial [Verrucomicrobiia bacterium]
MKNYKLLTLALCFGASSVLALTADQYVTAGTNSLVAQDMAGAYSNFNAAVSLSPTNEPANAFLAVTRLLVLPQQAAGSNFLNQLNVTNGSRNIYNWTASQPVDTNGNTIWPANYNSSTAITFYRNTVVAALVASATNLANITDTNFTLALLSTETGIGKFPGADATLDYGDFLLLRALVAAGQFAGYTINAQNASVIIPTLQAMSENNGLTIQAVLAAYPNLLTLSSAADLAASKGALTNAIAFYLAASDYIRNIRPNGPPGQGLFLLDDPKKITDEAVFRDSLTNVLLSVNGPVQFNPNSLSSLDLNNYFAATKTLRSLLPQFSGDRYVNNTLPDYGFGGMLQGTPACDTEVFLRQNIGHNYSAIYTGQTYDINFSNPNAGNFAILVNANQQATVVGDDADQLTGIFAQFSLDPHGNVQFTSNNVTGYGSFNMDGSFSVELDYTNGLFVMLSGYQLSPYGSLQTGAGYYGGSFSGANSGTVKAILGADGEVFFCNFQNNVIQDGGYGSIDQANHFGGFADSGAVLTGTYNPSTFTLAGTYTNGDKSTGPFSLSRSANIDLPPTITTPPKNTSVSVGANATFSVIASGSPPLCYQWYCNGVRINQGTNSNLLISSASLALNGNDYAVSVRNPVGNVIGEADADAILNVSDASKPSVNITNLVANQSVSNSVFRVLGTATDNAGVSAVWYQLNNGAWTLASTTNGWTNWWADLTLTAGTNLIRTYAVDIAGHGYVYVADSENSLIRKITPAGLVTTLAGDTNALSPGYADGTNSAARFNYPSGVATDGSGNVYVADYYNNLIRKITPAGVVTTLAGDTNALSPGYADGTNGTARFYKPSSVAVDGAGNVYVADSLNNLIRKITPAGVVTTLAGDTDDLTNSVFNGGWADGTNGTAKFYNPSSVAVDGVGNVYVADSQNNLIRKITPAGVVTTLAGDTNDLMNSVTNNGYADGTGGAARFNYPIGVATDGSGDVFVADSLNNLIRKITPAGVVTTLAGDTNALSHGYADGTNSAARFYFPYGVATDGSGNVFVADNANNLIRKITPAGMVTTPAGDIYDLTNGYPNGGYADGLGGAALFNLPQGVALDNSGANISATNQLNITFVVSATLTVTTNGLGSLNPNYNGAPLQIGKTYSIIATAGTGFAFSNWTGGTNLPLTFITNGTTVQFLMVTNLMLQANFVDVTRPTLNITNLTAGMGVSNAAFTVKGTAGDNVAVSNVFYSLNNSGWSNAITANNWSNWMAAVTLVPGTNSIAAYAVDTSGNNSITNTLNFVYV